VRAIELPTIPAISPISTTESLAAGGWSSRLARQKRRVADTRRFAQRRPIVLQWYLAAPFFVRFDAGFTARGYDSGDRAVEEAGERARIVRART
jgi:hypothetical protein